MCNRYIKHLVYRTKNKTCFMCHEITICDNIMGKMGHALYHDEYSVTYP